MNQLLLSLELEEKISIMNLKLVLCFIDHLDLTKITIESTVHFLIHSLKNNRSFETSQEKICDCSVNLVLVIGYLL